MAKNEGFFEEPNMSDATLLVTVEDLINKAMGPPDGNVVNFKLIQTILHILARQQRMLEQRVEIRVIEIKKHRTKKKHTDESSDSSSETSSPMFKPQKSPRRDTKRDRSDAFKSKADKKEREAEKEDILDKKKKTERTQQDESAPFKTKQTQLMVADEEDEDGTKKENIKALSARKKAIKVPEKGKEKEKRHEESNNLSQKYIRQREPTKISQKERLDLEDQQEFKLHDHKKKVRMEEDDATGERKKYEMSQKERMESEVEIDKKKSDEITMMGKQILEKRKQQVFENESKESEVYETDNQKGPRASVGYETEDGKYYNDRAQKERKQQLVSKEERNEFETEDKEEYIDPWHRERRIQVESHKERKASEEYETEYKDHPKIEKRELSHKKRGALRKNETDERKEQPQNRKSKYEISQIEREKSIEDFEEQKQFDEISQKESAFLKKYDTEILKDYKDRPQTEKTAGESRKEIEQWEEYETEEQQEFERVPKKEKSRQQKIDKNSQKEKAGLEEYKAEDRGQYAKRPQNDKRKEVLLKEESEEYKTEFSKEYLKQLPKGKIKQVVKEESVDEEHEMQKKIERMPQTECKPEKCDKISQKYRTVSEKYEKEEQKEYNVKLQQQKGGKQELFHKETEELEEYETKYRKEYKKWPQNEKLEQVLLQKETEEYETEHKKEQEVFQKEGEESEVYETEDQKEYKERLKIDKRERKLSHEIPKELKEYEMVDQRDYTEQLKLQEETEASEEYKMGRQKEYIEELQKEERKWEVFTKRREGSEDYETIDQKEYKEQPGIEKRKQEISLRKGEESEEHEAEVRKEYKKQEISEKKLEELAREESEGRKHLYRVPRKSRRESSHEQKDDNVMEKQKGFEAFQIDRNLERAEAVTRKESEDVIKGESEYDETKIKTQGERKRLDKQQKTEKEDEKEKAKQTTQEERKKLGIERKRDKPEKVSPRNGEGFEKDEKIKHKHKVTPKDKEKLEKEKKRYKEIEKIAPHETQKWEDKKREKEEMSPQERQKLEKEKIAKMSPEERHKWEKEDEVDKRENMIPKVKGFEKEEKIAGKERKRQDKIEEELPAQDGQATVSKKETKLDRKKPPYPTSIEITEKIIDNEKILVVERKPVSRADSRSSGSIDVVTRSQFELLADAVQQLRGIVTPQPLALPDNKQLLSDVLQGTATLPDAMQTLQVDARLRAAENAVVRMAGLLTQLASAGELPDEMFDQLQALEQSYTEMQTEVLQEPGLYRPDQVDKSFAGRLTDGKKSVAIDPKAALGKAKADGGLSYDLSVIEPTPTSSIISSRPSAMSRSSRASSLIAAKVPCVTYDEMKDALKALRDEILKCLNNMTQRAASLAETSLHVAKGVAEKLDVALQVDDRISILFSVVEDYAEQLRGFDSGLTTQMQSFQDQMAQMRSDLQAGLVQLEKVNNNAETAAVLELTERYEELAGELESTLHAHKALTSFQEQLSAELRGLVECMEMLREQKADRDEVLDGLRDKADTSKLAGLLSEAEFAEVRADFERRIDLCHDKFNRQDEVWQTVIRDLKSQVDKKAELVELLAMRDDTQKHLQHINDQIRVLAAALGEPKAALVTRKLAEDTSCGACRECALMEPCERAHGAPRALPALRPPPVGAAEEPCLADWAAATHTEERHICHRWAGGSHTLVSEWTRRVVAPPARYDLSTRKYTDYGDDGRLYKMEMECQPCVECNLERAVLMSEEVCLQGAGDTAPEPRPEPECGSPET